MKTNVAENNTEQWLLEGKCSVCRRAQYCTKDCKAHKTHLNSIIKQAFMDVMEEKNPGYKELMNRIQEKY